MQYAVVTEAHIVKCRRAAADTNYTLDELGVTRLVDVTEARLVTGGLLLKRTKAVAYALNPASDLLEERLEDIRGVGYSKSRDMDGENVRIKGQHVDEMFTCFDQILLNLSSRSDSGQSGFSETRNSSPILTVDVGFAQGLPKSRHVPSCFFRITVGENMNQQQLDQIVARPLPNSESWYESNMQDETVDPIFDESCHFVVNSFSKLQQAGLNFELWDDPIVGGPKLLGIVQLAKLLPSEDKLRRTGAQFSLKAAYYNIQSQDVQARMQTQSMVRSMSFHTIEKNEHKIFAVPQHRSIDTSSMCVTALIFCTAV
eukprot:SAG31_NODE_1964_length_6799_cov_2.549552_4_plen_314_part_00